jgi:serine phosphatase RsbU (regulator of sigma subunit)
LKNLWKALSTIGQDKLQDPGDLRQLTILNRIVAVSAANLLGFIPIALYLKLPTVAAYVTAGILLSSFALVLNNRGFFKLSRVYFLVSCVTYVSVLLIFMSGRDGGSQIVFILLGTLHLVLFKTTKWSLLVFLGIVFTFAFCGFWVETHGALLDYVSDDLKRFSFYLNIISGMILVFAVVFYFKNTTTEYEITITQQNANITQKNKDITDSITYAKRIQEAILPPDRLVKEFLPDSFILYKPKDIVAGDFYWMEQIGNTVIFAAADCTGHGVPGAMVSVVCNNALNRSLREFKLTQPGLLLDKTRELVIEQFEKSDAEVKDGMDISLCCLNKTTKQLSWAGANNPLWIIRSGELIEIKPDKQPIGKYLNTKPFTTHDLQLQNGDLLYIFTDGYADQFGGKEGKKLKASALKKTLLSFGNKPMPEQKKMLYNTFEGWRNTLEQLDDVCIIGVLIS